MTLFAHLIAERDSGDPTHALSTGCWCGPDQCDGEWGDRPAVFVDHLEPAERDRPQSVFLVDDGEGEELADGETLGVNEPAAPRSAGPPALTLIPGGKP